MPSIHRASHRRAQRGLSLIELMVGVTIGVLCVLIILQILSVWEARKRTVTSGASAQMSGALAEFTLDRDLRLAGYGFGTATSEVMGCSVVAGNTLRSPADVSFILRPVEIVKGVDDAPDEIRALYGNSAYFVASQPLTDSGAESKTLKSRDGFNPGDRMLVTGNSPVDCALVEVTGNSLTDTFTVEHEAGKSYVTLTGQPKSASMNVAGGTGSTFSSGRVYNLGPAPVLNVWTVDTSKGSLTRYDFLKEPSTSAVEVASDVVTLKAQYGIDTDGDGEIATGEWTNTAAAGMDWTRVRAVRFAVLVRSRQFERPITDGGAPVPVTQAIPSWAGGAFVMKNVDNTSDSGSSPTAVDGPAGPNNWRNYRYRVYESVVPLRNMIWGTAP
ncbi:MAG: PilW family protein [Gammaproteobacteria bacterium]|nr:PilW family protein [Gammaproteobacteria bacterium]